MSFMVIWKWFDPPAVPLASDEVRAKWTRYLQTDPDAQVDVSKVSELLLREARYSIDNKMASIRATEAKASSQIAILGGGLGIVSILGISQTPLSISGRVEIFVAACILLVISAIVNLICIVISVKDLPHIDIFNSQAVVADPRMKGRVGMSVAEGYLGHAAQLLSLSRGKARLQGLATVLFGLGILMMAGNLAWADTHARGPAKATETAKCRFTHSTVTCEVPQLK